MPELLSIKLSQNAGLQVVERARLGEALRELKLQQSGMVQESDIQKLGNFLGASMIVYGTILQFGGRLRLGTKILDVRSGTVAKGFDDPVDRESDVPRHVDQIAEKAADFLVGPLPAEPERPAARPERASPPPRAEPARTGTRPRSGVRRAGIILLISGASLFAMGVMSGTSATTYLSAYEDASSEDDATTARARWGGAYAGGIASTVLGGLAAATGGVMLIVSSRRAPGRAQAPGAVPPLLVYRHSF